MKVLQKLLILGVGKMGGSLLKGLASEDKPSFDISIVEPNLAGNNYNLISGNQIKHYHSINEIKERDFDLLLFAVKPQVINEVCKSVLENLKQTNSFFVPIFMDEENYLLEIIYLENELLQTKWGAIDCMVFKPKMQEGRVFEDGEEMKIWITDDGNHLLMKVETKIWAGTIKAVLVEYKELKFPLSINQ